MPSPDSRCIFPGNILWRRKNRDLEEAFKKPAEALEEALVKWALIPVLKKDFVGFGKIILESLAGGGSESVVACFDKKLEASRLDFWHTSDDDSSGSGTNLEEGVREVDLVLTAGEILEMLRVRRFLSLHLNV